MKVDYSNTLSKTITIVYPLIERRVSHVEKIALLLGNTLGYCNICSSITFFSSWNENFRESGVCLNCSSTNRQRQIAAIFLNYRNSTSNGHIKHTKDDTDSIVIFHMQSSGPLHVFLNGFGNYTSSEYFGNNYKSGCIVQGILHEDTMNLSFPDSSFDIVVSSDVFEHIPNPYMAHREVYRVLKPSGRHIFTVPFYQNRFKDEERAIMKNNRLVNIMSPIYHQDPLRTEGALVYRIFSLEMLIKLSEIGFYTKLYKLYRPFYGIIGSNAIVFEAIKE